MYTIAAIATPHAAGGISVIRISGDSAVSVAQTCFRSVTGKSLSEMPGYTCAYGKFCDPSGAELDDGIATVFRAPHSYTGEDTVEFSCHGGIFVTQQLLESVYAAGAVPAEPGEFTKRAFLAGKMTLTQAEAVMDVIGAAENGSFPLPMPSRTAHSFTGCSRSHRASSAVWATWLPGRTTRRTKSRQSPGGTPRRTAACLGTAGQHPCHL
ncbi:MAG: hypothetical protein ACLTXT_06600 [Ruminococcus callidus]